tara:strand:- start:437 stop:586 length:150 start_codon:yes stop_codon:yes gene_type:complete
LLIALSICGLTIFLPNSFLTLFLPELKIAAPIFGPNFSTKKLATPSPAV